MTELDVFALSLDREMKRFRRVVESSLGRMQSASKVQEKDSAGSKGGPIQCERVVSDLPLPLPLVYKFRTRRGS